MSQPSQRKLILISGIGSLIEYYDFAIYVVRPFGGIVFGHLGDVFGRKSGLVASIVCMGIPLLLMALLPTYQSIGLTAAFLLLACRLFQGLSAGGELPSAITYLAEHASIRYRGLISSFTFVGINIGLLVASGVGAILSHFLSTAQLSSWGWRLAFATGALLAILGYWIRRQLTETPIFLAERAQRKAPKFPLSHSIRYEGFRILNAIGVVAAFSAAIPVVLIFMPVYLSTYLHLSLATALLLNTLNIFIFIIAIPIAAWLSDCIGRKPILLTGALGFLLLSMPCYHLIQQASLGIIFIGMVVLGLCTACVTGPLVPALAEFFKTTSRSTSVALAYNISVALFGGSALVIITTLIHLTGNIKAPAWVMMTTGLISAISILIMRFQQKQSLSEV